MQCLWDLLPWELQLLCLHASLRRGLSIVSEETLEYNEWVASWEKNEHLQRRILTEFFLMRRAVVHCVANTPR